MKYLKTYKVFEIAKPPGAYYSNLSFILSQIDIDDLEIINTIKDSLIPLEDKNYKLYISKNKVKPSGMFQKEVPVISTHIDISENGSYKYFYANEIEEELLSFESHINNFGSRIVEISGVCKNDKGEVRYDRTFKTLNDLLKSKYHYMSITINVFLDINFNDIHIASYNRKNKKYEQTLIIDNLTKEDVDELLIPLEDIVGKLEVEFNGISGRYRVESSEKLKDMYVNTFSMNDYYISIFDELKNISNRLSEMYGCELDVLFVNDRLNLSIQLMGNLSKLEPNGRRAKRGPR